MNIDDEGPLFRYDPWNPDASQARKTAEKWRGGHWRSPLFCYVSNGCAPTSEEHRKEILKEIERDIRIVDRAAEYFHEDERDKLRNLKRHVEITRLAQKRDVGKENEGEEEKNRPDIELIF